MSGDCCGIGERMPAIGIGAAGVFIVRWGTYLKGDNGFDFNSVNYPDG